jgi:serine/threonine-protein kinase RsbW
MISVIESVNNAIVHGNKSDSTKNVSLSLSFQENAIQFYVEDEGNGFDYNNLPDPTSPENLDNPGGRGIFLIKNLCDEVDFANSGRTVTLTFYIN